MFEHSGHYCIVKYKCKVNVSTSILCTGFPATRKVTDDALPLAKWLELRSSSSTPFFRPQPGGSCLLLAAEDKQVDSAVSPQPEQSETSLAFSFL